MSFIYHKSPISDVKAPYLPFTLSDPLEQSKIEILGLVDTGYDGEVLIPKYLYDKLNLESFEYSLDVVSIAETASGEHLRLLTTRGAIRIDGSDLTTIVTIDSHEKCKEVIIGRSFLENYNTLLKGREEKMEIEFVADDS